MGCGCSQADGQTDGRRDAANQPLWRRLVVPAAGGDDKTVEHRGTSDGGTRQWAVAGAAWAPYAHFGLHACDPPGGAATTDARTAFDALLLDPRIYY